MASNNHRAEQLLKELHQPKKGASEKGCDTRHQRREPGHKCSHQWQAKEQADAHPDVYNYPKYRSLCGNKGDSGSVFRTAARIAKSGNLFPPNYALPDEWLGYYWKNKPTHEGKEWDLNKGENFNHYTKPYWHNAHHIIPNGALKAAIAEAANGHARSADIITLIRAGLLKAEYNINDKINMIILPQERVVANALSLPRHLKGDETGPDEKKEFQSHEDYSRKIQNKLKNVMKNYKEAVAEAFNKPDHLESPDALSKAELEDLSETTYDAIIKAGPFMQGKPLSVLRF